MHQLQIHTPSLPRPLHTDRGGSPPLHPVQLDDAVDRRAVGRRPRAHRDLAPFRTLHLELHPRSVGHDLENGVLIDGLAGREVLAVEEAGGGC